MEEGETELSPLRKPKSGTALAVANKKLYCFGGNNKTKTGRSCEVLNLRNKNKWEKLQSM